MRLLVIAGERKNLTTTENLKKYRMGTSANVIKIKELLLNAEIIVVSKPNGSAKTTKED